MEQQEEPGSSLMNKSPHFVYVIKWSSENLIILLCSALITQFLLFHHIL